MFCIVIGYFGYFVSIGMFGWMTVICFDLCSTFCKTGIASSSGSSRQAAGTQWDLQWVVWMQVPVLQPGGLGSGPLSLILPPQSRHRSAYNLTLQETQINIIVGIRRTSKCFLKFAFVIFCHRCWLSTQDLRLGTPPASLQQTGTRDSFISTSRSSFSCSSMSSCTWSPSLTSTATTGRPEQFDSQEGLVFYRTTSTGLYRSCAALFDIL